MSSVPPTLPLPTELDALTRAARSAIAEWRPADALEAARALGFKAPKSGIGPFLCGQAQLQLGETGEALRSFQEAVRLERHHPGFLFQLARLEMELGELDLAKKRFQEVLRLNPRLDGAHINIGAIHARRGDRAGAMQAFQRALLINGRSEPAHTGMAEIALAEGSLADALTHADAALRAAPRHLPALLVRAQALELRGEAAAATAAFQAIVEVDADHPAAWTRLALLQYGAGREEEARTSAARALAASPEGGFAQVAHAIVHGETPPSLPASMVAGIFEQFSTAYDRHMTGPLRYRAPQMSLNVLSDWLAARTAPVDALDLGCGTGLFGALLRPRVASLLGVDLSAAMLALAERRGLYDRLAHADLLEFLRTRESASVDLIAAVDVFIYVGALEEVMAEIARVLRPSGAAAFTVELAPATPRGYRLMPSGRYQHTGAYVEGLAAASGLQLTRHAQGPLRDEGGAAQDGGVFCLLKDMA